VQLPNVTPLSSNNNGRRLLQQIHVFLGFCKKFNAFVCVHEFLSIHSYVEEAVGLLLKIHMLNEPRKVLMVSPLAA
jgi:hypothetical protein